MSKRFNCCFEEFVRDHIISMFTSYMKLTDCSFHQMKHFHCTMNITLKRKFTFQCSLQQLIYKNNNKTKFDLLSYLDHQCNCHLWLVEFFLRELWLPFDKYRVRFLMCAGILWVQPTVKIDIWYYFKFFLLKSIVLHTPLTLFIRDTTRTDENANRYFLGIDCIFKKFQQIEPN